MSQLYLPADHTDADLVLAGQVAEWVASRELYVTWTPELGQAAPEIAAEMREPRPHWTDTLALVIGAVGELLCALLSRQLPAPAEPQTIGPKRAPSDPAPRPAAGEAA